MFDKMPFWGQILIMAVLAALMVGGAYWMWPGLQEKGETIAKLEADYQEKERKIRQGQTIEARLPEFEREIASLERKLEDIATILPTGPETGDLLRWIKNLGDQSNLDLKYFSPGQIQPVEFYKEFPIEMRLVGRYHDLGIFLDRVSKYSRIINVSGLSIQHQGSNPDKSINTTFTATTFVYDEKSAAMGEDQ
jgi:type IV pilus assembly protein PilO